MADATISTTLELKDASFKSGIQAASRDVKKFGADTTKAAVGVNQIDGAMQKSGPSIVNWVKGLVGAYVGIRGVMMLKSAWTEYTAAATTQIEKERQLSNAMLNTAGNTAQSVEQVKRLASELQKRGVVDDDTLAAGAKELAMQKLQGQTIQKLMPVMADYIAKTKGYNATVEDGTNVGMMFGRAMAGQVMAFRRSGIIFTDAQTKLMTHGTNTQKAELLTKILTERVGGLNAALAATPRGQIQQATNAIGDMKEEIGLKLLPIEAHFYQMFMQHSGDIMTVGMATTDALARGFDALASGVNFLKNNWEFLTTTARLATTAFAAYIITQNAAAIGAGVLAAKNAWLALTTNGVAGALKNVNVQYAILTVGAVAWMKVFDVVRDKSTEVGADIRVLVGDLEGFVAVSKKLVGFLEYVGSVINPFGDSTATAQRWGAEVAAVDDLHKKRKIGQYTEDKRLDTLKEQTTQFTKQKYNIDDMIRSSEDLTKKNKDGVTTIRNEQARFYSAIKGGGYAPGEITDEQHENTKRRAVDRLLSSLGAKSGASQPQHTPASVSASPRGNQEAKTIVINNYFQDMGRKSSEQIIGEFIPKFKAAVAGAL